MGKVYKATDGGRRHGSTPGTVGLAGQRVPIRVPQIRGVAGREIPLRSYEALRGDGEVNDRLLTRVLYGISCRNYEAAAEAIPGAIGLSGSTVSREFLQASAAKLRELQERDLAGEDVVAVVLEGDGLPSPTHTGRKTLLISAPLSRGVMSVLVNVIRPQGLEPFQFPTKFRSPSRPAL